MSGQVQGSVDAIAARGVQLLLGQGAEADPREGLKLILQAARAGSGMACATAATLFASGVVGPQSWPRALDLIQRGAELGFAPAQAQLQLLADPSGSVAPGRSWAELRRSVSLDDWRVAPMLQSISADPDMRAAEGFVAKPVCDWIIARSRDRLERAKVFDNLAEAEVRKDIRTNSHAGFDLGSTDLVLLMLRERMAAAAGLDVATMEAAQALHYAPGEEYAPHFDFMDPERPGHAGSLGRDGQRAVTLLVYLNEDYEGGETDFPRLGVMHRGRTGGIFMFRNADASGKPDRRMLHAGRPPTSGEKWILSQWVRDRRQPWAAPG